MILHRCFAWDPRAEAAARGGALWFPRALQAEGRHDAPERFGCLYASEEPLSAVMEELARFGGTALAAADLRRGGRPLALARLRLADSAVILDLDSPRVLVAAGLRPSLLATGERELTQAVAEGLHERLQQVNALRWWSALESRWANLTLFDRARNLLTVEAVRALGLEDEVVQEAAGYLGLRAAV